MKKIVFISIFTFLVFVAIPLVRAQNPADPTETPPVSSDSAEKKDIEVLKEKVANKVSEIRKKNNKAISGFVLSNKESFIKIKTDDKTEYEIKLDDSLTKYFRIDGGKKKEIKADDIEKDSYIIVTGVLTDKTVTANSIFVDEKYLTLAGRISEVDKEDYSLKIITAAKDEYSVDIENSTKQYILDIKTEQIGPSGFSKIKEGDTIHFVIKKTADDKESRFSATKILIIPQEYFLK